MNDEKHEQDSPAYWLEGLPKKCSALKLAVETAIRALKSGKPQEIKDAFEDMDQEEERVNRCVRSAMYAQEHFPN